MYEDPHSWVSHALSDARFAPHLEAASGDREAAIALYSWNVEISSAFMVPLHWMETATRNAVNQRLREMFGRPDWWVSAPLDGGARNKVQSARVTLHHRGRDAGNPDSVVAELTLGFWVSLLAARHHRTLSVPGIAGAFPGLKRAEVHKDYRHVLVFRNRVMHHEPIHHRHLEADHATLCRLIGQLSKEALAVAGQQDRVLEVLDRRRRIRR